MKQIIYLLILSGVLAAQSFYVLTGVDNYDAIVVNNSAKTSQYNEEIKALMLEMSKDLGVDTKGHPSRVLVFLISDVSMGETVGLKIELELGEYVKRKGLKEEVFGITYLDSKLIAPDFKDAEDVEDQLADAVEEMLERFKVQYKEDNHQSSPQKKVTHETFADDMGYETNYQTALFKAKKEGKDVMIFMTTSYCPWCRKLENRILSQSDIDAKIKAKYVPLMLNLDKDTYPKQFAKIRFTPILYVVNSKDESIKHQFVGYSARDEFLHFLNDKKEK